MELIVLCACGSLQLLLELFVSRAVITANDVTPDAVAREPKLLRGCILGINIETCGVGGVDANLEIRKSNVDHYF